MLTRSSLCALALLLLALPAAAQSDDAEPSPPELAPPAPPEGYDGELVLVLDSDLGLELDEHHDADGDGLANHVEDADDDGVVDPGETDPLHPDTDRDGESDGEDLAPTHIEIPEPMVFDLVRGLGAHAGEVEINALVLSGPPGDAASLRYAPEIEVAFADGFGVELELPMQGVELEAIKGALQGRFSSADEGRWMHGFQVIAEYLIHDEAFDAHLLWLVSGLITPDIAFVGMLGGRATTDGNDIHGRAIANVSAYHAIGSDVWLGAEVNSAWDPHLGRVDVRAMPQVHVSLHRSFRLQLGLGVEHSETGTQPFGGGRVILQM